MRIRVRLFGCLVNDEQKAVMIGAGNIGRCIKLKGGLAYEKNGFCIVFWQ